MRAFGRELCEGVILHAQERGDWELRFMNVADLRSKAKREDMDGFIARVTSDDVARRLAATGKPVVDVYYQKPYPGFAIVKTNHERLGALAAEHFLDRRFRNFAYCPYGGGRTSRYCQMAFSRRLRRAGFKCAVYGRGGREVYEFDDESVIGETISHPRDAAKLAEWLLSLPKPVAVFCPGDLRAWQLIAVAREAGISVPRELAVLGLDNDMLICGSARPMLSSLDPNARRIGLIAAQTLDSMMANGVPEKPIVKVVDPAGLVERTSTETVPVDPPWLCDALLYIWRNAKRGISAQDVFDAIGRSHTAVSRAFKQTFGETVQHTIAKTRLDEAERLLATSPYDVTRIAEMSGFASVSYLHQAFAAAYGMPPGEWRRLHAPRRAANMV